MIIEEGTSFGTYDTYTVDGGNQRLADALATAVGPDRIVRCAPVEHIGRSAGSVSVTVDGALSRPTPRWSPCPRRSWTGSRSTLRCRSPHPPPSPPFVTVRRPSCSCRCARRHPQCDACGQGPVLVLHRSGRRWGSASRCRLVRRHRGCSAHARGGQRPGSVALRARHPPTRPRARDRRRTAGHMVRRSMGRVAPIGAVGPVADGRRGAFPPALRHRVRRGAHGRRTPRDDGGCAAKRATGGRRGATDETQPDGGPREP